MSDDTFTPSEQNKPDGQQIIIQTVNPNDRSVIAATAFYLNNKEVLKVTLPPEPVKMIAELESAIARYKKAIGLAQNASGEQTIPLQSVNPVDRSSEHIANIEGALRAIEDGAVWLGRLGRGKEPSLEAFAHDTWVAASNFRYSLRVVREAPK